MEQCDTDQQRVADDAASCDASGSPAAEDSSPNAAAATPNVKCAADLQVLARVPDLETTDLETGDPTHRGGRDSQRKRRRGDGRVMGQGLSTKLLAGAVVVLVLIAVVPRMFRSDDAGPADGDLDSWRPEVPAPAAGEAPLWSGVMPDPSITPADGTNAPLQTNVPAPPDWSGSMQAPTGTPWQGLTPASAWPNGSQAPLPDGRMTDQRSTMQTAIPNPYGRSTQYGVTGGPAGYRPNGYGNYPSTVGAGQPQARANQTMAIGDRASAAPTSYSNQRRWNYSADTRAYPQTRYPARPNQSARAGIGAGVARFDGTIERPPVRTSYERARQSIH